MSGEEERPISVPTVYVDAAEIHTFPHTVQILLGANMPGGVMPRVQLALAPGFAVQLVETLQRAMREYKPAAPDDQGGLVATENSAE